MSEWLEMADGQKVEDAYVVQLDGFIAIYAAGIHHFTEAYGIFGNREKTAVIRSSQYGEEETWEGYTELMSLQIAEGGAAVTLWKEGNADG